MHGSVSHVNKGRTLKISDLLIMKCQVIPGVGLSCDLKCLIVKIYLVYSGLRGG